MPNKNFTGFLLDVMANKYPGPFAVKSTVNPISQHFGEGKYICIQCALTVEKDLISR